MLGVAITIITVVAIVFGGIMTSLFVNRKKKVNRDLTMEELRVAFELYDYKDSIKFSSAVYTKDSILNMYDKLLFNNPDRRFAVDYLEHCEGLVTLQVKKRKLSFEELMKQNNCVSKIGKYTYESEVKEMKTASEMRDLADKNNATNKKLGLVLDKIKEEALKGNYKIIEYASFENCGSDGVLGSLRELGYDVEVSAHSTEAKRVTISWK